MVRLLIRRQVLVGLLVTLGGLSVAAHETPSAASASVDLNDPVDANDPAFMGVFNDQYGQAWGDGAISARNKQLTGMAMSVMLRCDVCLSYHMRMAAKEKATMPEMVEAMRLGLVAGGSAGIPTMRNGYAKMRELGLAVKPVQAK